MNENSPQGIPKFLVMTNERHDEKKVRPSFYVLHTYNPSYLARVTASNDNFETNSTILKLPWANLFFKIEILKVFSGDNEISEKRLLNFVKTTLIKFTQKDAN